ncbi:polysaccharide biosynthesis protein [Cellulosimicrobium cellulans]|uniref:polysaccharide biosynthesis protein n=1 Tax=Cellulosimicrobium cellulans TaxID=1710 RepID=UPI001112F380|nr:polysaccharide biosynthesis protein [Cellulosimicrobium cellulans]
MRITAASLAGAVAGYVVLAIAARTLTLEDNALFVTFWAALLTSYGILTGLNTETSRAVAQSAVGTGTGVRAPRAGTVAAVVAAGVAAVCLGTAPLWGGLVFGEDSQVLATVVAASAAAYAVQATLLGALSGRGSWDPYAAVIAVEALGRVLIVTLVALWASDVVPLAWAAGAAAAAWTIMLVVSPASRAALASRVDAPLRAFLARSAVAAVAAGASAVLLVGFPVLTSLTTPAAVYAGAAPLMLAITLTRAPIMVPLTSFQSVIVSQFVHNQEGAGRAFLKFSGVVLAVGVVGAALAYPVGPPLMALLFGEGYRVDGIVLSAMTFASAGTALLTISGAFCQARNRHGAFVTGWLVALVVSVAILAVDADVTARVVGALVVGPYCGLAVHLAALRRELVRRRPTG